MPSFALLRHNLDGSLDTALNAVPHAGRPVAFEEHELAIDCKSAYPALQTERWGQHASPDRSKES